MPEAALALVQATVYLSQAPKSNALEIAYFNAATTIRREFGIEAAQVVLGHTTPDMTVIYTEKNMAKAAEVAAKIG